MSEQEIQQKLAELILSLKQFVEGHVSHVKNLEVELAALKIKQTELVDRERALNEKLVAIDKQVQVDRERKLQLDMKEKQLTAEKARLQSILDNIG